MRLNETTNEQRPSTNPSADLLEDRHISDLPHGGEKALAELYELSKSAVYGFAMSILKNHYDAEDVMQETFLKIYAAAENYTARGKPMAWILTITRNLALMKLREARNKDAPLETFHHLPGAEEKGASESVLDRMVLENVMDILTDEERQIITLHAISGLKHREIAEIIQIPLSTSLSKYRRGLAKLKKSLKNTQGGYER